jgi:hypothetical protein
MCGCKIIKNNDNTLKCPEGKFLRSYYPLLKKGVCCSPCTQNENIIVGVDKKNCYSIQNNSMSTEHETELKCRDNHYINEIHMGDKSIKGQCCPPKLGGNYADEQHKLEKKCDNYGLDNCNKKNIEEIDKYCKQYDVKNCTNENLNNIEAECKKLGMRVYDRKNGNYFNADSFMECSSENVENLTRLCKQEGIEKCNWTKVKEVTKDDINNINKTVEIINDIQEIYGKKINSLEKNNESESQTINYYYKFAKNNKLLVGGIFLCFCVLFLFLFLM